MPLILGLIGLAVWLYCERYPVKPVIPPSIVTQRTSIVGYIQTLLQGILIMLVIYYLPTGYFQVRSLGLSAWAQWRRTHPLSHRARKATTRSWPACTSCLCAW